MSFCYMPNAEWVEAGFFSVVAVSIVVSYLLVYRLASRKVGAKKALALSAVFALIMFFSLVNVLGHTVFYTECI